MFEALNGVLKEKGNLKAVIDVGGIEFHLIIPISTYNKLPQINQQCRLLVELVISDKNVRLYGFATREEKALFNELRKLPKIGAQTALGILSNISIEQFYKAIEEQNKDLLTKIPGIGKKTALSIIVELSQRLPQTSQNQPQIVSDTIETLTNLGFDRKKVENIVNEMYSNNRDITLEELVKESIRKLGKHGN